MNSLIILKDRLQTLLNNSEESEDFLMSIEDAIYACSLGCSALNTIFQAWCMMPADEILACPHEIDYFRGCCVVQDEWNIICKSEYGS